MGRKDIFNKDFFTTSNIISKLPNIYQAVNKAAIHGIKSKLLFNLQFVINKLPHTLRNDNIKKNKPSCYSTSKCCRILLFLQKTNTYKAEISPGVLLSLHDFLNTVYHIQVVFKICFFWERTD